MRIRFGLILKEGGVEKSIILLREGGSDVYYAFVRICFDRASM